MNRMPIFIALAVSLIAGTIIACSVDGFAQTSVVGDLFSPLFIWQ